MEKKFTSGPWLVGGNQYGWTVYKAKSDDAELQIAAQHGGFANAEANARLIATAPDLFEALEELCDLMQGVIDGDYEPDSFTLQPARAALSRAVGE